jgi:hypothetical protein
MSPARVGFNAPSSKNSRLIFAQQPRPNDKRNPLLHVLRTSGTGRAFEGGALLSIVRGRGGKGRHRRGGNGAEQGRWGRSAALSTPAQGRWMGREGAERERNGRSSQRPHGRTRTSTDKHGRARMLKGWQGGGGVSMVWKKVLPLRSQSLAGSSGCAGRYRPRVRSAPSAELGTRLFHGVEKFYGATGLRGGGGIFSMVWKKVFHGVGKFYGATGLRGWGCGGYWRSWVMAWWRAGWWVGVRWYRSWRAAGGGYWA